MLNKVGFSGYTRMSQLKSKSAALSQRIAVKEDEVQISFSGRIDGRKLMTRVGRKIVKAATYRKRADKLIEKLRSRAKTLASQNKLEQANAKLIKAIKVCSKAFPFRSSTIGAIYTALGRNCEKLDELHPGKTLRESKYLHQAKYYYQRAAYYCEHNLEWRIAMDVECSRIRRKEIDRMSHSELKSSIAADEIRFESQQRLYDKMTPAQKLANAAFTTHFKP